MTGEDDDRRIIVACARAAGIDPDDDCCPDIDAIVAGGGDIHAKLERFRDELCANFRRRARL